MILGLSFVEGPGDADGAVSDAGQRNQETKQLSESHHGDGHGGGQTSHGQVLKTALFGDVAGACGQRWSTKLGVT